MSLGGGASYYRPAVATSDPFQFAVGRYSSPDGLKFGVEQTAMMYDERRCFAESPFSAAAAFDARCSPSVRGYDYVPSSPYPSGGEYGSKTSELTPRGLAIPYGQGLDRVQQGQSASVNHVGTSPQISSLQTIYPWMRSMTTGMHSHLS